MLADGQLAELWLDEPGHICAFGILGIRRIAGTG